MSKTHEGEQSNAIPSDKKKEPDKLQVTCSIAGVAGSALIIFGNFMGSVNWDKLEAGSFIESFTVSGVVLILSAATSLLLILLSKKYILLYVGLLALAVLTYTYHHNQSRRDSWIESGDVDFWSSSIPHSANNYSERREAAAKLADSIMDRNLALIRKERRLVWISLSVGSLLLVAAGTLSNARLRRLLANNLALYEPKKI